MNGLPEIENLTVEFKTSFNEDVVETLTAFANTVGGTVYVGVADNGKPQGITVGKETVQNWVNEIKTKTNPQIIPDFEITTVNDKTIVSLDVQEYPVKPVSTRGKYFKRIGNSNHLLSAMEVANMHIQTVNSSWDYYSRPNKTINDISLQKVEKTMDVIRRRDENFQFESIHEYLLKNELLFENNEISNGCFLMFSKEENLYTTIQMGHFASEIIIKDDVVNSDDILTQVEEVMRFVKKHISKELIITDTQIENIQRWQYPLDALREIVLNMIIHRDYAATSNSIVKIFSDHILFFNPGILPDSITLEQLKTNKYISTPRNRQIAKTAKEMGIIERYGTGIRRVRSMFVEYGLEEPRYEIMSGGMAVTVFGLKFRKENIYDVMDVSDNNNQKTVEEKQDTVEKTVVKNMKTVEEKQDTMEEIVEENTKTVEETVVKNTKTVEEKQGTVGGKSDTVVKTVVENIETVVKIVDTVEENTDTVETTVEEEQNTVEEKSDTVVKTVEEKTDTVETTVEEKTETVEEKQDTAVKTVEENTETVVKIADAVAENTDAVVKTVEEEQNNVAEKSDTVVKTVVKKSDTVEEKQDTVGEKSVTVVKTMVENTETVVKITAAIKSKPEITIKELVELTGLSRRGIEWNIRQLKDRGVLERVGANKSGYWVIKQVIMEKTVEGKQDTVVKITAAIKSKPKITIKELVELTGLSRRGIEWNIRQLKDKGILERVGSNKGGSWIIKKDNG